MSDTPIADSVGGVRLSGCTCAPICERADDDVCDHCEYMDGLADEVRALENGLAYWDGIKDDNVKLKATIEKLQAELGHEQNANKALWDVLTARIKKLEKALKATTEALGDHYCGVCGNAGDGEDQPYHTATEAQTCDGCRGNWQAWRAGKDLLDD